MKTNRDTAILIVLIFILTLLGSEIFTLMSLNVYGMLSLNYRTQVYSFSPYAELAYLLVGLVVITSIILLLIKYKLGRLMFWMFVVVSFMIMLEFLSMFFIYIFGNFAPDLLSIASIGVYLVTALALVYYYKYAGIFGRNVVNVLMFLTVASILSLALGPIPSLILVGVIAIYDYISVFVTKHMVTLASSMGDNTFLGGITLMAKKAKKRVFLGGGDLVFPAILVDSLYVNYPPLAAAMVGVGAVIGLVLIMVFGKKNKVYPAMSVIGPMQILFFGLYLLTKIL